MACGINCRRQSPSLVKAPICQRFALCEMLYFHDQMKLDLFFLGVPSEMLYATGQLIVYTICVRCLQDQYVPFLLWSGGIDSITNITQKVTSFDLFGAPHHCSQTVLRSILGVVV